MSAQSENPFPGLRPFELSEHYLFFGRDGQSEEVVTRLERNRFVAVVGTSGSGKSSLVRAGLLPALYSGSMMSAGSYWKIAVFRPGDNPTGNLARALSAPEIFGPSHAQTASGSFIDIETTLRRSSLGLIEVVRLARMQPHENLLVVVDQFEELFRFKQTSATGRQQDEAAAFVKLLLEAFRQKELPIYVVLTMRSDYLGECAQFRDLPEAINKSQYLIPRMTDDERREAITGPVAVSAAKISSPLVNRLLNDAGDNPDQLPILQHALMRTWDYWERTRSDSEPIDIPHYEEVGGLANALSLDADKAYQEMSAARQKVAEKLFKCLTERGPDNQEIRRPTTVREIGEVAEADPSEVIAVIDAFRSERRSFLMTPDSAPITADTRIDISHESLIRGWGRLKEWVEEEAQSAHQYRKVADSSVDYARGKGDLLTGAALQNALEWREQQKPNQAWAARYRPEFAKAMAFLNESKAARETAIAEREQQQKERLEQQQRLAEVERQQAVERAAQAQERAIQAQALVDQKARSVRRLYWLVAGMVVMFLLASGVAVYAFLQRTRAKAETARANEQTEKAKTETERANKQTEIAEAAKAALVQQKDAAVTAKLDAEDAKDKAVQASLMLEQAVDGLKEAKKKTDAEHARAEAASLESIQRLGNLYGAAFAYIVAGKDEADEETQETTLENLDEIRKIYKKANLISAQITTLAIMAEFTEFGARKTTSLTKKQIELNKELLSLLGKENKAQRSKALITIADIYSSSDDQAEREKAIPYYEQMLSIEGLSRDAEVSVRLKLSDIHAQSKDRRISEQAIKGYEEVILLIKEGLNKAPSSVTSSFTLQDALIRLGAVYEDKGNTLKAKEYFNQAVEALRAKSATYDSSRLLMTISQRLLALDNKKKAEEFFDKAIEDYSNRNKLTKVEAAQNLVKFNTQFDKYSNPRAFDWYLNRILKLARELNDTNVQTTLLDDIGDLNRDQGKFEEAIGAYKELLSMLEKSGDNNKKAAVFLKIGDAYYQWKRHDDEALKYANKALDAGQTNAENLIKKIKDRQKKSPQ